MIVFLSPSSQAGYSLEGPFFYKKYFVCARSQLRHTGSLAAACKPLVAAYDIQFPDQGSSLDPCIGRMGS